MNTLTHPLSTYWLVRNRREPAIAALASFLPDVPYLIALGWGAVRYGLVEGNAGRAILEAWSNPIANFATQKLSHNLLLVTLFGLVAAFSKRDAWKAFAFGWAMHVWVDLSLHVKDAYAVLWPLTRRVFPAPVSYWDSEHHAAIAGPILALMAAVLWAWLARRRWPVARVQAVACATFAVVSVLAIVAGPRMPERVAGSWAEDGLVCLPPVFEPAVSALGREDGAAALEALEGVDPARVVADEGCPGLPSWAAHDPAALRWLLSGYAHDLAGSRDAAIAAYHRAERLETVGSVGDKARRYQGEPFRNVADPPVGTAWMALFAWGLGLCAVLFTRLRRVENP